MAEARGEPYSETSPQSREIKPPSNRAGVSLHQAVQEWGRHFRVFYELERKGQLVGIHVGNRVWYSRAQLIALLGEPPKGGYQQGFDLETAA